MHKYTLAFCFVVAAAATLTSGEARADDCFLCSKESTGACSGAQQCKGTRESCRDSGCKISGTASCSTAANVKICSDLGEEWERLAPRAEDCFLCSRDSTDGCSGAQQCRGTRESCTKSGCKISGTASCSTAANVKICSEERAAPMSVPEGFEMSLLPPCSP